MPPMWIRQPKEVYQAWYDAIIEEASDILNDFENSFMSNIEGFIQRGTITERQAETLERIYSEKTK